MRRILILSILASATAIAQAQVFVPYALPGSTYSENFDSLSPAGSGIPWVDGISLPGWYSNRSTYNASDGFDSSGSLYSFGTTASTERALGAVPTDSTGTIRYGVRIRNTSSITLTEFTASYYAEWWREGGSTTRQQLVVDYSLNATDLVSGTYTNSAPLTFSALPRAIGPRFPHGMNGNLPQNRIRLTDTITGLNWAPGTDLWLRWSKANDPQNDHGYATDDFQLSAVPEPATIACLGLALLGLVLRRRRT